jgi:hypothetical protein
MKPKEQRQKHRSCLLGRLNGAVCAVRGAISDLHSVASMANDSQEPWTSSDREKAWVDAQLYKAIVIAGEVLKALEEIDSAVDAVLDTSIEGGPLPWQK